MAARCCLATMLGEGPLVRSRGTRTTKGFFGVLLVKYSVWIMERAASRTIAKPFADGRKI